LLSDQGGMHFRHRPAGKSPATVKMKYLES
jgi:hypothetical protein